MELIFRRICVGVLLICVAVLALVQSQDLKARCEVQSGSGIGPVSGVIELTQLKNGTVQVEINLKDLPACLNMTTCKHGFHVHAVNSLEDNCNAAGPHLNRRNKTHGGPKDEERHDGDLGNVEVPAGSTTISTTITDWLIKLEGENSIMGKPIVIHEGEDDLGRGGHPSSNTTGNAGKRLGCCIIKSGSPSVVVTIPLTTLLLSGLAVFFFRATLSE